MTSTTPMTPPQHLFRELTDLGNLIFNMLASPDVKIKRWPPYYRVYLEVDRLCSEVRRATGYLACPFFRDDGRVDADRVNDANACFSRIEAHFKACVDLLALMDQWDLVDYGRPALKKIVYQHFSPKSIWYLACHEHYCAGRLSLDGRLLERTALLVDPDPTYRVQDIDDKQLLPSQRFDLTSDTSRRLLVRTCRQVQAKLNGVDTALGNFFVKHCPSVMDLLHPSSL